MLELKKLQLNIDGDMLFKELSCAVGNGEVLTIMGPSGCGKSSLLAALSGCLPNSISMAGKIFLSGKNITEVAMEKRKVGILFQDVLLFPHMDVFGNLALAVPAKHSKNERKNLVMQALDSAKLTGFANRDVATLSGGQAARISLLRALLAVPKALLLDEPFSGLDEELKLSFKHFLKKQIVEMDIPTILVSHDINDIMGDVVINLKS
ncbi:MAG: ATP-binding cassette domain-containing protein [Desulfotalea sp.]